LGGASEEEFSHRGAPSQTEDDHGGFAAVGDVENVRGRVTADVLDDLVFQAGCLQGVVERLELAGFGQIGIYVGFCAADIDHDQGDVVQLGLGGGEFECSLSLRCRGLAEDERT
jgi:hypothetical protein